jgi:hypothetical protein
MLSALNFGSLRNLTSKKPNVWIIIPLDRKHLTQVNNKICLLKKKRRDTNSLFLSKRTTFLQLAVFVLSNLPFDAVEIFILSVILCVAWSERFTLRFSEGTLSLLLLILILLFLLLLLLLFMKCLRMWFGLRVWEVEGVVVGVGRVENGRGDKRLKNEEMSMLSVDSDGVFRNVKMWGDSWTLSRRENIWVWVNDSYVMVSVIVCVCVCVRTLT